jgi:hypothetical protein
MAPARMWRFANRKTSGEKNTRCWRLVSQCQLFNRRGQRQATIDETGVGADGGKRIFNHGWTQSVNTVQNVNKIGKTLVNQGKFTIPRHYFSLLFSPCAGIFTDSSTDTGFNFQTAFRV